MAKLILDHLILMMKSIVNSYNGIILGITEKMNKSGKNVIKLYVQQLAHIYGND